jgi:hypothetical protein
MKTTSEFTLACRELLDKVLRGEIQDPEQLVQAKKKVCKDHKLSSLPTNADIIISGNEEEQLLVRDFLRKKPVRTISGVAVVAAMTSLLHVRMGHAFLVREVLILLLPLLKATWGRNPLQCGQYNVNMIPIR